MIDLILKMIVAFEEFKTELNFTENDIDNIVKKYKLFEGDNSKYDINERAFIILLKKGYITKDQFAKHMDIEFDNDSKEDPIYDSFHIIVDSFDDVLSDNHDTESKLLDNNFEDSNYGNFYHVDVDQYWSDYTEETLKMIMNYCIDNKLEIEVEDEMIVMTPENTTLEKGDIYFKSGEYHTKLYKLINHEEGLEDLRQELNDAICEADTDANISKCYKMSKDKFNDNVGEFEWKTIAIGDKTKEKLYIYIHESLIDIEKFLIDTYGKYEFNQEDYGNIPGILKDGMEIYDYYPIDFNYVYIDDKVLNDYTQDKL